MPLKLMGHSYLSLVTALSQVEGGSLVLMPVGSVLSLPDMGAQMACYQGHVEQRRSFKLGLEIKAGR